MKKLPVIPGQTQEAPDILAISWCGPVGHFSNLCGVRRNAVLIDNMAQVRDALLAKRAFGLFNLPVVATKEFENLLEVLQMIHQCSAIYENIVEKDDHTLAKQWAQGCVHCT